MNSPEGGFNPMDKGYAEAQTCLGIECLKLLFLLISSRALSGFSAHFLRSFPLYARNRVDQILRQHGNKGIQIRKICRSSLL